MRFRPWLLSVLVWLAVAPSAQAAEGKAPTNPFAAGTRFDQRALVNEVQDQLREPYSSPKYWLDMGVAVPVGGFNDRNWEPGLLLRWSERVWREGPIGIVGSAGFLFNDDSRFNEAQIDASYDGGFDSFIPIYSRRHLAVPIAVELQFEPASEDAWSPFVSAGPAIQYTHEVQVRQQWYVILTDSSGTASGGFAVTELSPSAPVPLADQALTKTHFHPGAQARAGLRIRAGGGPQPLHIRLTASANVWYEHSHPTVIAGGAVAFGK